MRDDICTIPVSEVFEKNDGCPICRMRDTVEERIIDYIMGDAMMEPDVRIETNKVGFCEDHYNKMMSHRGRLQLALMLQTHIYEINNKVFSSGIFNTTAKKGEKVAKINDSCFICDKIEYGISRMIDTIYRCYENEKDFRELFNSQSAFCLPHYERLVRECDKRKMRSYGSDFLKNITRITSDYSKTLYDNLSEYCRLYDYRADKNENVSKDILESVERTTAFLNGRYF